MSQPAVANTYVQLLCEFEPCAVLPFLKQHHEYLSHCIRLCGAAEVWDAEVYLRERRGEWEAVLVLHLRNAERRNHEIDNAVRSGAVPAAHVGSATARCFSTTLPGCWDSPSG
ncbi:hypothetical protein Vretifemale_18419 [Volvox reticuliferus]|uniref:Uncharacterized protein n=1 Tax=Volvox reticuliferus TaxID=1737510 RepID=A0A8J4FUB0_9CHLO|nr:hypothetical protein Vretifemale_18419 [Volvox reticuliferus]